MNKAIFEELYKFWFIENFYSNESLVKKGIQEKMQLLIKESNNIEKLNFTTYNETDAQYLLEDNSDVEKAIEETSTDFEMYLTDEKITLVANSKKGNRNQVYENVTADLIKKLFEEMDEVLIAEGFDYTFN